MDLQLSFNVPAWAERISYNDQVMLTGTCFAENIGRRLSGLKFNSLQNPNGILYDPVNIANSLVSYIDEKIYTESDLFFENELWQSWNHHGRYSHPSKEICLQQINDSQRAAHSFLKTARWLFITPGTAFLYELAQNQAPVANCHKLPARHFTKRLLTIEDINTAFDTCMHRLFHFNPGLRIVFTVSPVRYIRDGIVENNLSKSRLLEAIHHLVSKFNGLYYFPAYELVIDVLRDYRFFEPDMVHPNAQAIDYVFEQLRAAAFDPEQKSLVDKVAKIMTGISHRTLHPGTGAAQQFRQNLLDTISTLEQQYAFLNFDAEKKALSIIS